MALAKIRRSAGMLAELLQEALQADPVDVWQEQHEARPADRLGIQPEPMVLVVVGSRRAAAERTPQPAMRDLQTKTSFVHGEELQHRKPGNRGGQLIF